MKNLGFGLYADSSQYDSGSAGFTLYIEENFQLTHDEAIMGQRRLMNMTDDVDPNDDTKIKLVVIDGEVRYIIEDELPPNSVCLPPNSALLNVQI